MGDGAGGEAPLILSAFSRERGGICPARSVLRRTASSSRKETCQNGGAPVRACLASLERLRECEDLRGRRKRTTDTGSAGTKQPWSEAAGSRAAIQACCIEFFIPCTSPPRRASILHYGVELWTRPEPVQEGDVGIHAYASQCEGIGGELKTVPADFVVTELLQDGQEVSLEPEGAAAAAAEEEVVEEEEEEADEEEWDEAMLVRFVLRKEKQDTLGAVADLAEALGVPERAFSYAGLKDFHAVTVQEVVVQGVPPSRLRALQLARLQLGRIRLVERKLRLGECGGNRFRIRLRRLTRGRVAVDAAMGALRERGFLNYFGLQRFGSHASRNDEVGRALLLGEYEQAVLG